MTLEEAQAEIAGLQAQLVAMDRVLAGRTVVANSVEESALLLAPYIQVVQLGERGSPMFAPRSIEMRVDVVYYDGDHGTGQRFAVPINDRRPQNIRLNQSSRLIIAVVNPQP